MFDSAGCYRIVSVLRWMALVVGLAAGTSQAAGWATGPDGFLTDSRGEGVRTGYGDCWKSLGGDPAASGCLMDSDSDGVPDERDRCPNTPKGVAVGADGCPVDNDADGIPDFREVVQ